MRNFFLKSIISVLTKSSILVGGQAVINGVMMRVPGAYATAVRLADGKIKTMTIPFKSYVQKNKFLNIPIVRGAVNLFEALKIGYKTLNWSSQFIEDDSKSNFFIEQLINLVAVLFALSLFFLLPIYCAGLITQTDSTNAIFFNIAAGSVRISIFILYLFLISCLKDVQTLFQYHGAEHKTIYTFESGTELSYSNAKKFKKEHPRCGTSFLFIVMLVSIFSYSVIDSIAIFLLKIDLGVFKRTLLHLACLPLVAGISYEVLKLIAQNIEKNIFLRILAKPGLILQKITTKEPTEDQLEVAFESLIVAFGDNYEKYKGKKYKADAIG